MSEIRTLVLAVDFSKHSEAAEEQSVELARKFDASVHVVHAFELPIRIVSPYEVAVPDPYIEESRKSARERLDAVVERLRAAGIAAEPHLAEVPAAPAIARVAESTKADLIVMGTRGLTGLKHLMLGSVAERTMRLAPCSVLAVKTAEDSEGG